MTNLARIRILVLLVAPFLAAACNRPYLPESTHLSAPTVRVPLDMNSGLPVANVWINRRGPYRFLVDTGAVVTMIDPRIADDLNLPTTASTYESVDPYGRVVANPGVRIGSLQVGAATLSVLEGASATCKFTESSDRHGVLGVAAFADMVATIDMSRGELSLTRGSLLGTDAFSYAGDCPTIPAFAAHDSGAQAPCRLTIDTGSTGGVSLPRHLQPLFKDLAHLDTATFMTFAGRRENFIYEFTGKVALGRNRVIAGQFPIYFTEAGLIGCRILKDCIIKIDPTNKLVALSRG